MRRGGDDDNVQSIDTIDFDSNGDSFVDLA